MQPATADQVASEAGLLSREQLQTLARAATVLGREVEEVTSNVTNYVQQLQGLTPAALAAATRDGSTVGGPCSWGGGSGRHAPGLKNVVADFLS
jgi:hypothetical protein